MSGAYLALAITSAITIGVIAYVHYDQEQQIARMRKGVYADAVREQTRRRLHAAESSTKPNVDSN